jgi:hypothetical protein
MTMLRNEIVTQNLRQTGYRQLLRIKTLKKPGSVFVHLLPDQFRRTNVNLYESTWRITSPLADIYFNRNIFRFLLFKSKRR